MHLLLLTADLMCSSQVKGGAERLGLKMAVVTSVERLLSVAAAGDAPLVVLDLNTPGLNAGDLVPKLRSLDNPPGAIVAFGPHVHEARLAAAVEAGCDAVYSRGQFYAQVEAILRQHGPR